MPKRKLLIIEKRPWVVEMISQAQRRGLTIAEFIKTCYQAYMETCSTEAVEHRSMASYEND